MPRGAGEQSSLTAMTLDLIVLTLPYLSNVDATSLFELCLSSDVLESRDNAVQKRGYKILGKLVESGKVPIDAPTVLEQLDKLLDGLSPAAKKVGHTQFCVLLPRLIYLRTALYCSRFSCLKYPLPVCTSFRLSYLRLY